MACGLDKCQGRGGCSLASLEPLAVSELAMSGRSEPEQKFAQRTPERIVTVVLEIQGIASVTKLAAKLASIDGVVSVNAGDVNVLTD